MTPEQFMQWAAEEMHAYESSPGFKSKVTAVLVRQEAGEVLSMPQIAEALEIPLWLAELSMAQCIANVQAHLAPSSGAVN